MKTSSLKHGGLSPPDCVGDPEEKEVSDDDDDDRNHKHRRRETRSQSMEREQAEQVFTRPYRKWNKPFENGHSNRDNDSQPHYNFDRDPKFEKRRFSRFPSELNQRMMVNPSFSSDIAYGRGRDWNHHDSRFNAVDAAYQMAPPPIFTRRGLPNLTNAQNAPWNAFGPMPGIPNGGIDAIHPIGLQGTLRPPINPSVTMGIPRQRCRDFEEQGFCLRGDMCPMEHGVNRIVVEDVQSLSQFNLPVSLPSAHLLTTPGSGPVAPANATTATLINGRNLHSRPSKLRSDDGLSLGGGQSGEIDVSVADVYDPDQPLWNNDCPEASTAFLGLQPPNIDESDSYVDADPSDRVIQSSGTVGCQSTSSSVWGRIRTTRSRSEMNEKIDTEINTSEYPENRNKHNHEASHSVQGTSFQAKPINTEVPGAKAGDSSSKMPIDAGHSVRNLLQKAQRTLFVNRIPSKDNKKEALLSHFRKFGEVIHIYIPANSEQAFVQFSKKEDAERALKASDAVMGNRFIKLWWANRDRNFDDGWSGGTSALLTNRNLSAAPVANHPAVTNKFKATLQVPAASVNLSSASKGTLTASDDGKTVAVNGRKAAPPSQKELERLEMLKEIHKKQKMLDQKRDEFRRQLDKLEKKDVGTKGDVLAEVPAKRLKLEITDNSVEAGYPESADPSVARASSLAELSADKSQSEPNAASRSFRATLPTTLQEPSSLKQPFRPSVNAGGSFVVNRYKLDNRPTAFKVSPPLPSDLANVDALRDHFAPYGDLSSVELDYLDTKGIHDGVDDAKSCSAHIRFKARQAAERAFLNGKTWHGHNLQFTWLAPGSSSSGKKENSPAPKELSMEVPSAEKQAHSTSQGSSNVRGNSLVAVKEPQGAEVQSAEKSAYAISLDSSIGTENSASVIKGTSSGADAQSACYIPLESNESEEGEESGIEHSEAEKDVQSSPMLVAGKIQSLKDEMC